MGSGWLETVAEAERRAKKRLPKSVYWAVVAGSEQGATLADNVAAFRARAAPHAAGLPARRDLSTMVLGQPVSMPVILSPACRRCVPTARWRSPARRRTGASRRD
jgi:isopentenyl diphosphate isomerase/L-lactate dehydrogenase-like FMN-dependent dehydrogenase